MTEIVLPRLGWTMEEGVFQGWLKRDGESVKAGEAVFSVEGDKAVVEIEALATGTVRIAPNGPKDGDTIPVGTVLGYIESLECDGKFPNLPVIEREKVVSEEVQSIPIAPQVDQFETHKPAITPRARKEARERGVDVEGIIGTGRGGRIRERDLPLPEQSQRISPLRKIIAERMLHSQRTTAPVTLTSIIDATNLVNLRDQFKATGAAAPSFADLFIKLAALALQKHPEMNARWHDDGIVQLPEIHIGLAVDTPAGLLVPVIRDVLSQSLRQIASRARTLVGKARTRTLAADEMQGGTFTITNLGVFGIDGFTPIINWPECAILGIGAIRKRALVVGDDIVARQTATLSLTFDHRVIDGAPAARFLQTLGTGAENPSAWLLE